MGLSVVVLCAALAASVSLGASLPPTAPPQSVPTRHELHRATIGGWTLVVTGPTTAAGLEGAVLEASAAGRRVRVPLDTSPTARRARAIDSVRLHDDSGRLLILTDQAHDAPGLLVVDFSEGQVVEAVIGRHMALSPDARYLAFEEYFARFDTSWPWNETVYAVLDVTLTPAAMRRPCPYADDRCRGVAVDLPTRADLCAAYREVSGAATCLQPGRGPQHERRSPFVWLDAQTLAFMTVDRAREEARLVTVVFDAAGSHQVRRHVCDTAPDASGARCPPARAAWMVDVIRRDDDDGQLWIHFRDRTPEVPSGWLGFMPATPGR